MSSREDKDSRIFLIPKGKKVAVLDDELGIRMQWEIVLGKEGLEVDSFDSWESYLHSQEKKPQQYGAFVVDYRFENSPLNGGDILKKLRESKDDFLYLCTAEYKSSNVVELAVTYGATLFPKPVPKIKIEYVE